MDLIHGMVIFHQDDLEQYILLPVLHHMMLVVNLPLEQPPPLFKRSTAQQHVCSFCSSHQIFIIVSLSKNLIRISVSSDFSLRAQLPHLLVSGSIQPHPRARQYVGIASSASSDLRDFFHFVSSLLSCDLGELKSQCSIME